MCRLSYAYPISLAFPSFFFFFTDPATTEIYTLSLHDALPISITRSRDKEVTTSGTTMNGWSRKIRASVRWFWASRDRKSTRLNSSHQIISYAVFCLKKKKKTLYEPTTNETTLH